MGHTYTLPIRRSTRLFITAALSVFLSVNAHETHFFTYRLLVFLCVCVLFVYPAVLFLITSWVRIQCYDLKRSAINYNEITSPLTVVPFSLMY